MEVGIFPRNVMDKIGALLGGGDSPSSKCTMLHTITTWSQQHGIGTFDTLFLLKLPSLDNCRQMCIKSTIPSSQGQVPQWLCLFAIFIRRLEVPEQALDGISLGFGIVIEAELSCKHNDLSLILSLLALIYVYESLFDLCIQLRILHWSQVMLCSCPALHVCVSSIS